MKRIKYLCLCIIALTLSIFLVACTTNTIHKEINMRASVALNVVKLPEGYHNSIDNKDEKKIRVINAQIKMYELFSDSAKDNYTISPLSIYMAFSILYDVASDDVKKELEDTFNLTKEDFEYAKEVFDNVYFERYKNDSNTLLSCLLLNNSIWLDSSIKANQTALDRLANNYYCYAFNADFAKSNKKANKDIRDFIKSKTNGLIDKDFNISEETLFAIINTLYLKDLWNGYGDDLPKEKREFNYSNGNELINFLIGKYVSGQKGENDLASYFYTYSNHFNVHFVVPKDGKSINEVMKLDCINNLKDNMGPKETEEYIYFTRCIFPCFEANGNVDVKKTLEDKGLLTNAFSGFKSDLYDSNVYISGISHDAKLKVNEKGLEGAAVTIIRGAGAAGPDGREEVYYDFVVDREFGFYVTDRYGFIIFMGQVTNPDK